MIIKDSDLFLNQTFILSIISLCCSTYIAEVRHCRSVRYFIHRNYAAT